MKYVLLLVASSFLFISCKSTNLRTNKLDIGPMALGSLSSSDYQVLGDVQGTAVKKRILFVEYGDFQIGTLYGRQTTSGYSFFKNVSCIITLGLVCPLFKLNAQDAALYRAIESKEAEGADTLIYAKYSRREKNYYFYREVIDTVEGKAIRIKTDNKEE